MKKKFKTLIFITLICIFCISPLFLVTSAKKINISDAVVSDKNLSNDVILAITDINTQVNADIFNLPKVYVLPFDLSPAPKPNPANYTEDEYKDDTISVKCWRERIEVGEKSVTANFADVAIAHPSQLRTAFSGGNYSATMRSRASKIAAANNAVIAINADFYNYRTGGLIVRQGTLYRKSPFGVDTLFVDKNGDMSVIYDYDAVKSDYIKFHKIYQTLAFGPQLVENGKPLKKAKSFNCVSCAPLEKNPRTAIGQLGKLHYLICTIDGRFSDSEGVKTNDLAKIMADKGCIVAYNLDGGQSSVMIFNNKLYNRVCDGGERLLSDILYFSTAIPESEWNNC